MKRLLGRTCLATLALVVVTPAFAITITNQDGETRNITITENGARSERDIGAGETVKVCDQGCFITFPDGTLTAYQGNEQIVIRNGGPALAK